MEINDLLLKVTEYGADLLAQSGIKCEFRGELISLGI